MPFEAVLHADEIAAVTLLVSRVTTDVAHEQIKPPIVVIVEEQRARRMPHVADASARRDIPEATLAEVFKQDVTDTNRRDEQIRISIIVEVTKGRPNAHSILQAHTSSLGDVLKTTVTDIPPQLAPTDLIDEIQIQRAIPVDIGCCQTSAMIVVNGLVGFVGIRDCAVFEANAAGLDFISEAEAVEYRGSLDRSRLFDTPLSEPLGQVATPWSSASRNWSSSSDIVDENQHDYLSKPGSNDHGRSFQELVRESELQ